MFKETSAAIERHLKTKPYDYVAVSDWFQLALDGGRGDRASRVVVDKAKRAVQRAMSEHRMTDINEVERWRNLYGRTLLFESHYKVDSFFQYMEWTREPDKRFYLPRRRQLWPMIQGFQDILDDKADYMLISTPPGIGKTTSSGLFISMLMGLQPDNYILASAHSDTLTRSLYEGILGFVTDHDEYRWGEIFPNVGLQATNAKDQTINLGNPGRFKSFTARSIGGSLTGATRANTLLYADDLVSGIEEAMSKERLDKLWDLYVSNLKSRKTGACKEVHVATRWSLHDVIGRLERQYAGDDRLRTVTMPALDENDESNFDFDCNDRFTTKTYHDMRASMDDASWHALYMNEPIEREGLVYPEPELRRFFGLPGEHVDPKTGLVTFDPPDAILSVCDTKDKGKDYSFLPVGYVYGNDHYIVDCVCDQGVPGVVEGRIVEKLIRHGVQRVTFESNSAGGRIADGVQKELQQRGGAAQVLKRFTTSNKETRIIVSAHWVKTNCLFLDKSKYSARDDYGVMMRFLTSYSLSGKNAHDDVPDGFSMYQTQASSLVSRSAEVVRNPLWR